MKKEGLIKSLEEQGFPVEIISAFQKVKREKFVPEEYKSMAYYDEAFPLGENSTISQPYTIAFMLDLLDLKKGKKHKILEIGSGSGYVLALIDEITNGEIFGIELLESLVLESKKNLKKNKNIEIIEGNGFKGLKDKAPWDRILVSASSKTLPKHLISHLSDSGILVVPVGDSIFQVRKNKGSIIIEEFPGFVFVPLIHP